MKALLFLAVALAAFPMASVAQQVPDAGRLLEQQPQPPRPKARPAPRLPAAEPARLPDRGKPGVRVTVQRFRITGNTAFEEPTLQALLSGYLGREMDFNSLVEAALVITRFYRDRGYMLAQAYLPAQTIREGVIEIAVIEGRYGRVGSLRTPAVRLSEATVAAYLGPLSTGDLILEGPLERVLLLLSDLPGMRVAGELAPGEEIGTADLEVLLEEGPLVTGALDVSNIGARYAGEYQAGATLWLNNPLGYGDLLTIRGLIGDGGELANGRVSYSAPIGYDGLRAGVFFNRLDYDLGGDFAVLEAEGYASVLGASVTYPIVRRRQLSIYGGLAAQSQRLEDRYDAVDLVSRRSVPDLSASLSVDWRDDLLGGGFSNAGLTYVLGDVDLRSDGARMMDGGPNGRRIEGTFSRWVYVLSRLQNLHGPVFAFASLSGQFASKNLDTVEKFSLGGPTRVRSYPPGEALGDEAHLLTLELRHSLSVPGVGSVTISGFYDRGWATLNKDGHPDGFDNDRMIDGYGLGLNWVGPWGLAVTGSVAWRNSERPTLDSDDRRPRAYFQLVKYF